MNILIIEVLLTDKGIRLVDVDGTSVELLAEDALELATWIAQHKAELEKRVPHGRTGTLPDDHERDSD